MTMDASLFLADLEAKPDSLHRLAATMESTDPWREVPPTVARVLLLGMGSSRYAAQVAARRLRSAGIDAVAEYASAATSYPADRSTLVVAISASGASLETIDAVTGYPHYVALTNAPDSPLAEGAAVVVPMHAGVEAGGVACRTFQHTLVLLLDLVETLSRLPRTGAALARRAAAATADLLERRPEWLPRTLDLLDGDDGVYALAPAERLSSALQAALMIREGPRRPAGGCETGDWSHVDVYLTKTLDYRALLFPGSRYDQQAVRWLRERGARTVAVGGQPHGASFEVRYRDDDVDDVRLITEPLVAELVAAAWWGAGEGGDRPLL
jgi:glutamine---fructose-6-phosphate transaminase (isomerizing)